MRQKYFLKRIHTVTHNSAPIGASREAITITTRNKEHIELCPFRFTYKYLTVSGFEYFRHYIIHLLYLNLVGSFSVQSVLNLLQTQSFGFHHNEECEEEGHNTEDAEQPESIV